MKQTLALAILVALATPVPLLHAQDGAQEAPTTPPAGTDTPSTTNSEPAPEADQPTSQDPVPAAPTPPVEQPAAQAPDSTTATTESLIEADIAEAEAEVDEPSTALDAPADDEAEEEEKLAWRGTSFIFDQSLNTYALVQSSQLTHNPTYAWSFSFRPRYYLTDDISVRLRQDLDYELTDSDSTTRNREPVLSDTQLQLSHGKLLEVENLLVSGGVRVSLPTSIASRANELYFGGSLLTSAKYSVDGVAEGLEFGADLSYTHNFAGSNVTSTESDYPCQVVDINAPQVCGQVGGASTISDAVLTTLSASITPVEKLTFDVSFSWWWRLGRGLGDASVPTVSGPIVLEDGSDTHWRNLTWFTLGVGYDVTDWVNASLGLSTLTGQLDPDGSRRNPFYNVDSVVSLTATFALDALYTTMTATSTSEESERRSQQASGTSARRNVQARR